MNGVQTWGEAITMSLINLSQRFINYFPVLLGAIIVILAGWIIAITLGRLVAKALRDMRLDKAMEKIGFGRKMSEIGVRVGLSDFVGGLVKWFLILVFLMAAANILQLTQVTNFLNSIIFYIPNVVVAVVILAVVSLLGNFVYSVVRGSSRAAGMVSATFLAAISKWAIIIFGIFAALIQLGVASTLVSTIFIGIVAMISLAGGLAFGLGGKDEAALLLRKIREELTEKHK